jgi:hypothetical protein
MRVTSDRKLFLAAVIRSGGQSWAQLTRAHGKGLAFFMGKAR